MIDGSCVLAVEQKEEDGEETQAEATTNLDTTQASIISMADDSDDDLYEDTPRFGTSEPKTCPRTEKVLSREDKVSGYARVACVY